MTELTLEELRHELKQIKIAAWIYLATIGLAIGYLILGALE